MNDLLGKFPVCKETHDVWLKVKIYGDKSAYCEFFELFIDRVSTPLWRIRNGIWEVDERPIRLRLHERWAIREMERREDELRSTNNV